MRYPGTELTCSSKAGLLIKVDDKDPYDRFRGRLMIPIRDPRGRSLPLVAASWAMENPNI